MDSISPKRYLENHHHHHHQTLLPSPHHTASSNSSSSSSNNGPHHTQQLPPLSPTASATQPPPPSYPPKPVTRSESTTAYPTTFVQADSSSFKQVVQMLTGSSETAKMASSTYSSPITKPSHCFTPTISSDNNMVPNKNSHLIPPIKTMPTKQHQSGFKLYERRNNLNSKNLNINPLVPSVYPSNPSSAFSPRKHAEVVSPSILDFPALVLSPVTPLIPDPFDRSGIAATGYRYSGNVSPVLDIEAEEKAIKEKGFFLHPSPASTPRDTEPRLLPLFPTTSPKASGASSSSP